MVFFIVVLPVDVKRQTPMSASKQRPSGFIPKMPNYGGNFPQAYRSKCGHTVIGQGT
jgi:hypothetical protein